MPRDLDAEKAAGTFAGVITSLRADVRDGHRRAGYQDRTSSDTTMACECGDVLPDFKAWEDHAHEPKAS